MPATPYGIEFSSALVAQPSVDPNILNLDADRLIAAATTLGSHAIGAEALQYLYRTEVCDENSGVRELVLRVGRRLPTSGEVSFEHGVALLFLLVGASREHGVPYVTLNGYMQIRDCRNQFGADTAGLAQASNNLLSSQHTLSEAFDTAHAGLPKDTLLEASRFGGGLALLGLIAGQFFTTPEDVAIHNFVSRAFKR